MCRLFFAEVNNDLLSSYEDIQAPIIRQSVRLCFLYLNQKIELVKGKTFGLKPKKKLCSFNLWVSIDEYLLGLLVKQMSLCSFYWKLGGGQEQDDPFSSRLNTQSHAAWRELEIEITCSGCRCWNRRSRSIFWGVFF